MTTRLFQGYAPLLMIRLFKRPSLSRFSHIFISVLRMQILLLFLTKPVIACLEPCYCVFRNTKGVSDRKLQGKHIRENITPTLSEYTNLFDGK